MGAATWITLSACVVTMILLLVASFLPRDTAAQKKNADGVLYGSFGAAGLTIILSIVACVLHQKSEAKFYQGLQQPVYR